MNYALRMYIFVPYHLSGIQKGIQAGHAAVEYAFEYGHTELFKEFVEYYKTWIILNGGTTRDYSTLRDGPEAGELNQIANLLAGNDIDFSSFAEPDLNFALTAVCFIADERVWDFEKYPDFDVPMMRWYIKYSDVDWKTDDAEYERRYSAWVNMLGGEKNVFLRSLIKNKKLA